MRSLNLASELREALDPALFLRRLSFEPFRWQRYVTDAVARGITRIIINGARQAGKTQITCGIPSHSARHGPAYQNLNLIFAPSERQSQDDLEKVREYLGRDDTIRFANSSAQGVRIEGGGEVVALPSTEKTIRGKSKPRSITLDEASRIEDALYYGIRPMLVDNPRCILTQISTPWGKRGVFYRTWQDPRWLRIEVRAPWDLQRAANGTWTLVPAMPEREYQMLRAQEGIVAFYSDRHHDRDFMEEELHTIGEKWFRQEYLCEFVETTDSAFDYEDIDAAFSMGRNIVPLFAPEGDQGRAIRPLF